MLPLPWMMQGGSMPGWAGLLAQQAGFRMQIAPSARGLGARRLLKRLVGRWLPVVLHQEPGQLGQMATVRVPLRPIIGLATGLSRGNATTRSGGQIPLHSPSRC